MNRLAESKCGTARRSHLRAGLLLACAVALSGCTTVDYYEDYYKQKRRRKNDGREPAVLPATGSYEKPAVQTSAPPSNAQAEQVIAKAEDLLKQGQPEKALLEFERVIESNPRMTVAYMGAGDIYREQGNYSMAEQRYGKAAEIEPGNFQAQYKHGLVLQLLERISDAIQAYVRALRLQPDDFNANLNLATAYLQIGEPAQAVRFGERAVQIDGRSAPGRINLGAIYAALDRHADAVVEYQQASELTELSGPLLLNWADSLGKIKRHQEMLNILQQLVKNEPSAMAYERLGAAYFHLRQYVDAQNGFKKAIEIDPNHYPAHNGIGVCLLNQYEFSNKTDEQARQQGVSSLRKSLQIERNQPRIVEILSAYQ